MGVCFVLGFVGIKMLLGLLPEVFHVEFEMPVLVSLGVIVMILAVSIVLSFIFPKKETSGT
jgi:predicted tellurium resistance membrane protein TerC